MWLLIHAGIYVDLCQWKGPMCLLRVSSMISVLPSIFRVHSVCVPSQWETTLRCNVVSHWLVACTEWTLNIAVLYVISKYDKAGIILCMGPANERWHYTVMPSLIGWAHTQNDPWQGQTLLEIIQSPWPSWLQIGLCYTMIKLRELCTISSPLITMMSCDIEMFFKLLSLCEGNPLTKGQLCRALLFSCDQAALQMVFSVCLSVCPSVRLSVCHTFLTMFPSSYHHEIFRSYHRGPG